MKKFSKLVSESVSKKTVDSSKERTPSRFMNIVYWEENIKPLIDHVEENVGYIFSKKTKSYLDQLIDSMEEDYKNNWRDEAYDGSQEMFFEIYQIKVDYRDIIDCVQPLMDRTEDTDDDANFEWGAYHMKIGKPRFKNLEELIEDVSDVHGKLQMLNVDFKIHINSSSQSIDIFRYTTDTDNYIKNNWKDSWGKPDTDISRLREIEIFIYNKDTVEAIDLQGK